MFHLQPPLFSMADTPTKYFQIGRASEIRINSNNELELYFYDTDDFSGKIVNPNDPFVFNVKPGQGRFRFLPATLLIEANKNAYDRHEGLLTSLTSGINWQTAQSPTPQTMILMNPIKDPPKP